MELALEGLLEGASPKRQAKRAEFALFAMRVELLRHIAGVPSFREFSVMLASNELLAHFCRIRTLAGINWTSKSTLERASKLFSEEQMRLPTLNPDSTLHAYLIELADSKLAELGDFSDDLVDRVRREIWKSLPNRRPDLNLIARQMSMSARTLQRRLSEAGTSFSLILEDLRRELSAELRTNRGFAAADVAFMLGYSESSAYQRAARRWRQMP